MKKNESQSNSGCLVINKLVRICVMLGVIFTLFTVFACTTNAYWDNSCGGKVTYTVQGSKLIISGKGSMDNFTVEFDDKKGEVVSTCPFYEYRDRIKTVIIENGVTNIGYAAFYGFKNLTSITIPESVTKIEDGTIGYGYTNLSSIYIENLASWCICDIRDKRFNEYRGKITLYLNGEKVTNLDIPEGVTTIRDYTFRRYGDITNVTIPSSVTSIGKYAFSGCGKLTSVTIPNSVTSIGESAFSGCALTSVTIPNSVTSIDYRAFYGCDKLTSVIIPSSVTSIDSGAFSYCSNLARIAIPSSVTSIDSGAFSYCSNLTRIIIPSSVTSIDHGTFFHCSNLTSLIIPCSVTSIGSKAFAGCSNLTSVTLLSNSTVFEEDTFPSNTKIINDCLSETIGEDTFYYKNIADVYAH